MTPYKLFDLGPINDTIMIFDHRNQHNLQFCAAIEEASERTKILFSDKQAAAMPVWKIPKALVISRF
jgi:hypothetical protein